MTLDTITHALKFVSRSSVQCVFRVILLSFVLIFQNASYADPITKKEADEWVELVRRINNVGEEFDLKIDAAERARTAVENLRRFGGGPQFYRDLGDGLHTLGHMAEHEHRFEKAVEYHRSAFEAYSQSQGQPTKESWHDGRLHAIEHIFMNIYDLGIYHERLGEKAVAHRYFDAALGFAFRYELQRLDTERFTPRYDALVHRFEKIRLAMGRASLEVGEFTTPVLAELKCASVFISAD